jgi:hypothetical protein
MIDWIKTHVLEQRTHAAKNLLEADFVSIIGLWDEWNMTKICDNRKSSIGFIIDFYYIKLLYIVDDTIHLLLLIIGNCK